MIGDLFVNAVYWFLSTIIGWFPTSTGFPPDVLNAVSTMGGYLGIFAPIVPIGTLLLTVTAATLLELAIYGFKTFKWIISHIPVIGGKGV